MTQEDIQELLKNPKINELKTLLTTLDSSGVEIKELLSLVNKNKNIQNSINQIENMKNEWINVQNTKGLLKQALQDIENNKQKIDEFKKFYSNVFEGNANKQSIKEDIKNAQDEIMIESKKLKELYEEYEENYMLLYNEKEKKINELLTGATEASLSLGYKEKREQIEKSKFVWNIIFSLAILTFIVVFAGYFYFSLNDKFSYIHFLRAIPVFFFSGFFCYYSTKQIDKYSRLEQEYAYKESLSKTYEGYNKQIQELKEDENSELKIKLINIMLKSAELNPSFTLEQAKGVNTTDMLEHIKSQLEKLINIK